MKKVLKTVTVSVPFNTNDHEQLIDGNELNWKIIGIDEDEKPVLVSVHLYNEEMEINK